MSAPGWRFMEGEILNGELAEDPERPFGMGRRHSRHVPARHHGPPSDDARQLVGNIEERDDRDLAQEVARPRGSSAPSLSVPGRPIGVGLRCSSGEHRVADRLGPPGRPVDVGGANATSSGAQSRSPGDPGRVDAEHDRDPAAAELHKWSMHDREHEHHRSTALCSAVGQPRSDPYKQSGSRSIVYGCGEQPLATNPRMCCQHPERATLWVPTLDELTRASHVISPSTDPFSPKNMRLTPAAVRGLLVAAGLITHLPAKLKPRAGTCARYGTGRPARFLHVSWVSCRHRQFPAPLSTSGAPQKRWLAAVLRGDRDATGHAHKRHIAKHAHRVTAGTPSPTV